MALERLRLRRTFLAGAGGVALVLGAGGARGAPTASETQACMAAHAAAQQSEEAGRLIEEKDLLLGCMKPVCSRLLQRECLTRRTQLDSDIPTVIPRIAGDKRAAPPADLQIRLDGALLTSGLGEPVAVDPGLHELTFSTPDGAVNASRKVMILQGDLDRPVAVSLGHGGARPAQGSEGPAGEEPGPSTPAPPLAYVLGGLGVAGLGAGAAVFALGKQTTWNLAVDSLGIGAGALVGALWLFANPRTEKRPPSRAAYTIDVHPSPSGGVASLSGIF